MKLLKTIERIVFPSRCVFCTEVLPFGNKELICDECASRIEEISGIICEKMRQTHSLSRTMQTVQFHKASL